MIAGLLTLVRGTIALDGEVLDNTAARLHVLACIADASATSSRMPGSFRILDVR